MEQARRIIGGDHRDRAVRQIARAEWRRLMVRDSPGAVAQPARLEPVSPRGS